VTDASQLSFFVRRLASSSQSHIHPIEKGERRLTFSPAVENQAGYEEHIVARPSPC